MVEEKYLGYLILLCFVGHVWMGAPLPKYNEQKCDSMSLDSCFQKLQVFLKITSLPFVGESKELDKLCEIVISGYNCSQVMLQNGDCLSLQNKELLPIFISMAEYTYYMLCVQDSGKDGYLRLTYLENSDCILRHKEAIDCCAHESEVPDLPVLRILEESSKSMTERQISTCCPVSRFLQCASNVAMDCGESAANLTTQYIRRAVGEQVEGVCQHMPHYPEPDSSFCPKPVPTCSGSLLHHLQNHLVIVSLFLIIYGMYQTY